MPSIDERVVRLEFDFAKFQSGVTETLKSLDKLEKGLQLKGASQGLADISAASKNVSFEGLRAGVQSISDRFRAMSVVATTALFTITQQAIATGSQLVKSLTIDPILDGYREYETNLNSIQTILANTAHEGTNLKQVNAALAELNHYSDQTIYNFAEMAKNIGTFTAAGVSLEASTAAIKGIANLAAVSGSNANQASAAMYQLSQALAAGRVTLEDWNSVVNAGMGGKVFQDALIETAKVHGVAVDKMIKKEGSFRLTLQKGWLTSNILTETLNKFTGDLSAKQLKSMGYTKEQIAGIIKMGKTATAAATEVKTMTQLINTLQESVGSGWSATWSTIFGNFTEAKKLFTDVNNTLGGLINASSDARNKMLSDWKKLGGRTVLIEGISNAFKAVMALAKPIGEAFRSIFPPTTAKQLYDFTVAFRNFTKDLLVGSSTAGKIKRTFAGVFAIFGIGWEVVKQLGKTLGGLFAEVAGGSGDFLEITAKVGDFLVALLKTIRGGDDLSKFFGGLGKIIEVPIKILKVFVKAVAGALKAINTDSAVKSLTGLAKKLEPFGLMGRVISGAWDAIYPSMQKVWGFFSKIAPKVASVFSDLGSSISDALGGLDFSDIVGAINTGLFASLTLILKNFLDGLGGGDSGDGMFDGIKNAIEGLTGTLESMQHTLQATTLLEIAAAVGILALSVDKLSKIDSAGLTRALSAITVMFTQLFASIAIFQKVSGFDGFAKLPFIAASLIILGGAVNVLADAVTKLADLDWEGLAKGLSGVTTLLGLMIATVKLMPPSKGLITTGLGMIALSAGVKILASAVSDLSGLSWEEMAKGLTGVAGVLGAMALFTKFAAANKGGIAQGAGIILLAAGVKILASALQDLGSLSWDEIGRGLTAMAGGLAIIGAAITLIPPTSVLSAAAVVVVASSLGMIGDAVAKMGAFSWETIGKGLTTLALALGAIALAIGLLPPTSLISAAAVMMVAASLGMITQALTTMGGMSWEEIAKSLIVLAGALTIIAVAVTAMIVALPGAAALIIVAGALAILTPVLIAMGNMSWEQIAKGMLVLAGALTIIGVAGALLTPVIPTLIGLGVAVALIGVGMAAAGVGVLAFATGLTALSVSGAAATAAVVGIVSGLIGLIPKLMTQLALGLVAFAKTLEIAAPAIMKSMTVVLSSMLDAINKLSPKIVKTLLKLIVLLLNELAKAVPKMVNAGLKMLTGILQGISNNIGKIVTVATTLVVNFLNGISKNLPRVIQAGVDLILKFVNSLATAIRTNSKAMGEAGANLATAIVEGMVKGLGGGIGKIISEAKRVAQSALDAAKNVLGIHSPSREFEKIGKYVNDGFVKGLNGNRQDVANAFNNLKTLLKDAMKSSAEDIDKAKAKLERLTKARHKDAAAIRAAAKELAQARKEHKLTTAAYATLTKHLDDERDKLKKLADKYDKVTEKLKAAQDALADAKKTRDDYKQSITDQYSNLPEITAETKLTDYLATLKQQVKDTKTFSTALQKLRDMGLNDAMYKELLSKGVDALPFVQQILDSGKSGVDELNKLGKSLEEVSAKLAKTASTELYQAAVDSAQGLVDGLKKQQKALEKMMDKLADAMVKAIKKRLGIKSPSRVFKTVGNFSGQGLAAGLIQSQDTVNAAAEKVGTTAVDTLSKSLSGMTNLVPANLDISPTITPVIDLTQVKDGAGRIADILAAKQVVPSLSYTNAAGTSAEINAGKTDGASQTVVNNTTTFVQNNSSPKALSSADIYRQTRAQLARTAGALSTS